MQIDAGVQVVASRRAQGNAARVRAYALAVSLVAGCSPDPLSGVTFVDGTVADHPLGGLDASWEERFWLGDGRFEEMFYEAQGLGPVFIRPACTSCHADAGQGPGTVQKMVIVDEHWQPIEDQSQLPFGHTVRPRFNSGATQGVLPPDDIEVALSRRVGPPLFGRGYIEAIDDAEIERAAAEQERAPFGVTGVINRVPYQSERSDSRFHDYGPDTVGLIGRFGYKARIATLEDFTADALQNDMGLTSPLRPNELPNPDQLADDGHVGLDLDLEVVELLADYARLLAIPSRGEAPPGGAELFEEVGCATCHVPTMRTRDDYPVAALAGVDAPIFSDLLVHDMGEALADGTREHGAGGREWRTAPLVGLRFLRGYLHDGRADTLHDAVLRHGGIESEANEIVDRYQALSNEERELLLDFLSTL